MAIAKMLSMNLVGLCGQKEEILAALHKTGAVEIIKTPEIFDGKRITVDRTEIKDKQDRLERAADLIRRGSLEYKLGKTLPDGFGVGYDEFMKMPERESEINGKANEVLSMHEKIAELVAKSTANRSLIQEYRPYSGVKEKFTAFCNTEKTICRLGVTEERNYEKLCSLVTEDMPFFVIDESGADGKHAVCVIYHFECAAEAEKILSECAFGDCPFKDDMTANEKIDLLQAETKQLDAEAEDLRKKIAESGDSVKDLKTLSDYYSFLLQKSDCEEGFLCSDSVFVMEAYVPEERKDEIIKTIDGVTEYSYYEFRLIPESEYAPTLMRNKKVTRQFEFVTNLYSVPKYGSFDPNAVLGFFFSLFMGFITADAVYGLLMMVGGFIYAKVLNKRETTLTRLAMVMFYSGIFTILFGILFNSFLGFPLFDKAILPDPIKDTSDLAGIKIPTILLLALGMGVIHIMVGLFLAALIHFQHGRVLDGIFDGIAWDVFFGGALVAVISFMGYLPESVLKPALIVAVVGLAVGALTSGRHEKGLGKITKPFSSLYGLINYMSDILSYARLYGLMLSGAQIASIVSTKLAQPMLTSPGGVGGVIACVFILLLGHLFNIAMGLLGAFVHDARLQYVEFFSRFYEGDGELFAPFGMKFEHVYLK